MSQRLPLASVKVGFSTFAARAQRSARSRFMSLSVPPITAWSRRVATVASRSELMSWTDILSVNTAARFSPCAGVTSSQMAFARLGEYFTSSPVICPAAFAAAFAAAVFASAMSVSSMRDRRAKRLRTRL